MKPGTDLRKKISPRYRSSLLIALCWLVMILGPGTVTLDGGEIPYAAIVLLISFFPAALRVIYRRPISPTRFDLGFIRYGYPVFFGTFIVVFAIR